MKLPENGHLAEISKRLRTSSAVVPALLFTAICVPMGAAGLVLGRTELDLIFMAMILIPTVLTFGQIIFFTAFDRDRLQNEDHVERKMLLGHLRSELGDANSVIELENGGIPVENPALEGRLDV